MIYLLEIITEHNLYNLNYSFSYFSKQKVNKGQRVFINFRNQNIIGFVIDSFNISSLDEKEKELGYKIKEISGIIDEKPILNEELLSLAKDISKFYYYPLIGVLRTFLPPSLRPMSSFKTKPKIKYQEFIEIKDVNYNPTNKNEAKILERFFNSNKILKNKFSKSKTLEVLLDKEVLKITKEEKNRYLFNKTFDYSNSFDLSIDQENAYSSIINCEQNVALLKGVTGSGKTEIYIKLIENYLKKGKKALVLVPEVALTPLMISRIISYFDEEIAVLHSSLTNAERYDEYRKIANEKVRIVVGTRSAIFAPISQLGIIIIDEEHDSSYKQDEDLPYNAKEIAFLRLKYNQDLKIVLGSATPSIETMVKAEKGIYFLSELKNKYSYQDDSMVFLVDALKKENYTKSEIFSDLLIDKINYCLENNKQAILLINNRGYSRYTYCEYCGKTFKCPICNLSLTYHKETKKLVCHHCDYSEAYPKKCPTCGKSSFKSEGYGIEKVQEEFEKLFKNTPYLVLNSDKTSTLVEIESALTKFNNKEANILIGTQIVAKGHDFKDVFLSAIINADTILNLKTYKAREETFDLIVQTLGRAGRKEKGIGVIQTKEANKEVIKFASKQDYDSFYKYELKLRKEEDYPPYTNLIKVVFESSTLENNKKYSYYFKEKFEEYFQDAVILGPTYTYKINSLYRNFIYIKIKDIKKIKEDLIYLIDNFNKNKQIRIKVNFSPFDL